jgi:D-beta-D-heptose 7-phosphate kinase / D-beta-D-heptose 1-phosphate adenosyltransferase
MSERASLTRHIEPMARVRVLVIGDVMLDHFIYGSVDRVSPEAPIPVLKVAREAQMLGGAGNVARNIGALGGSVSLIGVVGDDEAGKTLTSLLTSEISVALVETGERPTTVKTRFVANGQQLLRADREEAVALSATEQTQLMARIDACIADAEVVVLSDYAKGVVTTAVAQHAVMTAQRHGKPVVVDTKAVDLAPFRGARLVTPNARELAAATRLPVSSNEEVAAAAAHLVQAFDLGGIVVTRSERGMTVLDRGHDVLQLATEAREVFDVSGAGDTVLAVLALALGAGADLHDAATLANVAAGIVVGKAGTAVVQPDELARALSASETRGAQDKIMSLDSVLARVAAWRSRGLSVGFTNGCFDILHPGHISLLTQARAQCDRLIVGLNTDSSVRGLKGTGRPVNSEMARAVVLGALEAVDAVAFFADETPLKLIEAIKPDVLVKGADYTIDRVVGADFVQKHGGRVVLVDLVPGQSTTGVIQRMNRS